MSELVDPFGRKIHYLRLSVTDRCDLRCQYCMPEGFSDFEEPEDWLSFEEITRVVRAFAELGTHRIRITGGEPLVRKGIPELVEGLAALPGIDDLSLSTNATRLRKLAGPLHAAGIRRLNVSLDSLDPDTYRRITKGRLDKVLDGLMAAKAAGFAPIKINMVVMKGINDHEAEAMVEFCMEHGFTLRFIETMPVGDTGREASAQYIGLDVIRARLAERYTLTDGHLSGGGPARYVRVNDSPLHIGFITPLSQHFCDTCNRVRLSADGTLYLCLGQDDHYALRPLLRAGIGDAELREHIAHAISLKPERHEFREAPGKVVRFMSMTGG